MHKKYYTFEEAITEYIEASRNPETGIATGYTLDRECGTMHQGELALLWARTGAGKSTLLLNMLANTPDVPTVFFNMEMRARTMAEWFASMAFNLPVPYRSVADVIEAGAEHPAYERLMASLEKKAALSAPAA